MTKNRRGGLGDLLGPVGGAQDDTDDDTPPPAAPAPPAPAVAAPAAAVAPAAPPAARPAARRPRRRAMDKLTCAIPLAVSNGLNELIERDGTNKQDEVETALRAHLDANNIELDE